MFCFLVPVRTKALLHQRCLDLCDVFIQKPQGSQQREQPMPSIYKFGVEGGLKERVRASRATDLQAPLSGDLVKEITSGKHTYYLLTVGFSVRECSAFPV